MVPSEAAELVERIIASASTWPTAAEAEKAIGPTLRMLRGQLHGMTFDRAPQVFTAVFPELRAGRSADETRRLFRHRLNDLAAAKRWTDRSNVDRVIESIIDDAHAAAMGCFAP